MPFTILRADLARLRADAIVNAANPAPVIGAGVDEAVHRQAGPQLLAARRRIGAIAPGHLAVTPAFGLQAKYVLHTVCPAWQGGGCGEEDLLRHCYARALHTARELGCESIAFPLLAAGTLGFPRSAALNAALRAIREFLTDYELDITLAVYDRASFALSETLLGTVQSYIDDNYVREHRPASRHTGRFGFFRQSRKNAQAAVPPPPPNSRADEACDRTPFEDTDTLCDTSCDDAPEEDLFCGSVPAPQILCNTAPAVKEAAPSFSAAEAPDWDALLQQADAGFSETLLQLIDRSGMTDAEVYKKANIDRKLFSKIRSNPEYRPSKPTALAFAFALELDLDETRDLLDRAGFSLSRSSKFDLVVECFLCRGDYDLFALNSVLFHYDLPLIGA